MSCSCCAPIGDSTARHFDASRAQKELRAYRKSGARPTTRALAAGIAATGANAGTLLDIGSGIGVLTLDLLSNGLAGATCIDLSAASLEVGRAEAERRGYADRIVWQEADFAAVATSVRQADVVTLDRVVCCYPAFEPLLEQAAAHARHVLALSFPRDRWYVRATVAIENVVRSLRGSDFRSFVHSSLAMEAVLTKGGLRRVSRSTTLSWSMDVYMRVAA
jgi:2-polyprenyl-3-methyl-5-hydroxy-6-metoxy-1,4-benzoquinol methylase